MFNHCFKLPDPAASEDPGEGQPNLISREARLACLSHLLNG